MDSFRGAKPAQDKTPKTKLTNSGCLSIPQNQAPQVPSRTQRNQLTLLGKETRPIRTYFTARHAKPTLQNVFISCIGFEVQRSSCEFMGAHCSFNLCSLVFMCVFFLAATQFLNFQKHGWCVGLFFCYLIAKTVS